MKRRTSRSLLPTPYSLLLIILLLAAGLRFYHLDAQSFWNDEGNSARIAERTIDLILEGAAGDIHPPGYYLLLHYWRALFGQSEFALRSLSVIAGLLLVVFTYLIGRRLFSETTGLVAAFLGAISPFAVYYSQEARMYALLAALSAVSSYLLFSFLADGMEEKPGFSGSGATKTRFLGYVLTSAAGLYVQYAFPFVLFVHNAAFGLWWLAAVWSHYREIGGAGPTSKPASPLPGRCDMRREMNNLWRWLALWAGAQVAIALLYLPWLPTALKSVTGWSSAGRAYELGPALMDILRVLGVGITLPVEEATAALGGAGLLLLAGLRTGLRLRQTDRIGWWSVVSIALYLLLPITLIFAFDLYKSTWLKFLVVVLPPFHLLIARGIENLISVSRFKRRLLPPASCLLRPASCILRSAFCVLLLGMYLVATYSSLCNLYFDPAYARDNYRQIAADVAALVRPGDATHRTDAIILNAPNQWEVFTYYYPDQDVYPAPYRPESDEVEAFLSPLVERYRRFFVLYWGDVESDPRRLVEAQLADWAYKAGDRWYGLVRLATYGVAPLPEVPSVVLDARYDAAGGAAIRLDGYALAGDRFAPGDVLPVTLFWEAQAPVIERYKVTVQLLDGAGQLAAQHDTEPGDGIRPTTIWEPGQGLIDRYGLFLPADLPPGRYTLIVGLYHVATGERLPITRDGEFLGDHLSLGSVQVVRPP